MAQAREHAVASGPILVEAVTYRYYHQNGPLPGTAFKYRTKDEEREWKAQGPRGRLAAADSSRPAS